METGLFSTEAPHKAVRRLQMHTFLGHAGRRAELKEHMSAYRHWKRSLRHPLSGATDLADPQEETLALQSALDGLYWTGVDAEQQE